MAGLGRGRRSPWLALAEQVGGAAEGADAYDGNRPGQLRQEADTIGCHDVHEAEQVKGNHEEYAEHDGNHHDRGRKFFHTRNIAELCGTVLDHRPTARNPHSTRQT
jgi:hypothetical protein